MKRTPKNITRKFIVLAIGISLIISLTACGSAIFRTVSFGMTRDEVQEAEQDFGEPQTVFDDESLLYEGISYAGIGGDLVYSFDEDGLLDQILFYAYYENYTDDAYIAVMTELAKAYAGSSFDAENPTVTDDAVWTDEERNVTVAVAYEQGIYLTVTLQSADEDE
jgi:hypothetical protein